MGLHPLEQEVLKRWQSYRRLYTFLEREFHRINRECFYGQLPFPKIELKRLKYSRDLIGKGYTGAVYNPPAREHDAEFGFYPIVLLQKEDALTALAHEMVHHWEWVNRERGTHLPLHPEVEDLIRYQFSDSTSHQHYDWRLGHSFKFIAKACEVATTLQLPIKEFLFKDSVPNLV